MTAKLIATMAMLTAVASHITAQEVQFQFTLKGVVTDSTTHEGEPFATISLTSKRTPDKTVKMMVTDKQGRFNRNITVPQGDYILTVNSMGRQTAGRSFTVANGQRIADINTVFVADVKNELAGVEIEKKKSLVWADINNIEDNIEDELDHTYQPECIRTIHLHGRWRRH